MIEVVECERYEVGEVDVAGTDGSGQMTELIAVR